MPSADMYAALLAIPQALAHPLRPHRSATETGSASAILQEIYAAANAQARSSAAAKLAEYVLKTGLRSLAIYGVLEDLNRATKSKSVAEREGAMVAYEELFRKVGLAGGADPYFIPLLVDILDRYQESGKAEVVKVAAEKAAKQLIRLPPAELAPKLIEQLFIVIESNTAKWRSKVGALELLSTFAVSAKDQVAERLGDYVPRLSGAMRDTKPEVRARRRGIFFLLLCGRSADHARLLPRSLPRRSRRASRSATCSRTRDRKSVV